MEQPNASWLTYAPAAMSLRKAAWVSKMNMQIEMPQRPYTQAASRSDLSEQVQDANRLHGDHADMHTLHKHILLQLWRRLVSTSNSSSPLMVSRS